VTIALGTPSDLGGSVVRCSSATLGAATRGPLTLEVVPDPAALEAEAARFEAEAAKMAASVPAELLAQRPVSGLRALFMTPGDVRWQARAVQRLRSSAAELRAQAQAIRTGQ